MVDSETDEMMRQIIFYLWSTMSWDRRMNWWLGSLPDMWDQPATKEPSSHLTIYHLIYHLWYLISQLTILSWSISQLTMSSDRSNFLFTSNTMLTIMREHGSVEVRRWLIVRQISDEIVDCETDIRWYFMNWLIDLYEMVEVQRKAEWDGRWKRYVRKEHSKGESSIDLMIYHLICLTIYHLMSSIDLIIYHLMSSYLSHNLPSHLIESCGEGSRGEKWSI